MEQWFDGVHLVGRYTWVQTGMWLLVHGGEAALLELPPASFGANDRGPDPAADAARAARELGVQVKFILCTHAHYDHFSENTFGAVRAHFPQAEPVLQRGFGERLGDTPNVRYFDDGARLHLGGEPLHLVHAPKHSHTDTMVIFRGAACTGDWELNTVRTVNERVPVATRLASCERMVAFARHTGYHVHRVYSAHANDRREPVDFPALMADTREDRKLW